MEATSERVRVSDGSDVALRVVRWGEPERPLLILLHGAGANAHWWDHLAPDLARTHHVVALDFRGHGDSDYPDGIATGAFGRDLEALLAHLGRTGPILVGHSLGAHVALEHAALKGDVSRLVLIDISRGASHTTRRATQLALTLRRTYPDRSTAIEKFRVLPPARYADPELQRAIAERSVRCEADGRFGFKFDARWFGLPGRRPPPLARVRCPTLVIRGAESSLLTGDGARELVSELSDARLVEIPRAGHHTHLDRPDAVLRALEAFLTSEG